MEGGVFVNFHINQMVDEGVNMLDLLNPPLLIPQFHLTLAIHAHRASRIRFPASITERFIALNTVSSGYRITVNPVSLYCMFAHHLFESAGLIDDFSHGCFSTRLFQAARAFCFCPE